MKSAKSYCIFASQKGIKSSKAVKMVVLVSKIKHLICFLLIIVSISWQSSAQPPYSFSRYRSNIPTIVEDMAQDRYGRLWIAGWSGLYRYDGTNFHNFRVEDNSGAIMRPSRMIIQVATDEMDNVWLLSNSNKLHMFINASEELSAIETSSDVREIVEAGKDIFFITEENIIYRIEYKEGSSPSINEYLKLEDGNNLNGIHKDTRDNFWVYTDGGIFRNGIKVNDKKGLSCEEYNGYVYFGSTDGLLISYSEETKASIIDSGTDCDIKVLSHSRRAMEFVIGSGNTLYTIDLNSRAIYRIEDVPFHEGEFEVLKDKGRNLWIYSKEGSLNWYNPRERQFIPFYNKQLQQEWDSEVFVRSAFIDMQDNVWIGGNWRGLEKAVPVKDNFRMAAMTHTDSSPEEKSVRSVIQTSNGDILAGTKDGRLHTLDAMLRPKGVKEVGFPVYDIHEDKNGTIWMAAKEGGIFEGDIRHAKGDDYYAPIGNKAYYITSDNNGRLWMAYFDESISFLQPDEEQRLFYSKKNRISFPTEIQNRMRFVCQSPDGKIFMSGHLGIFVCSNPDAKAEELRFEQLECVNNFDVQHIFFGDKGEIYASTYGHGFLKIEENDGYYISKGYTSETGLLSNYVLSAIEDNEGNIWIATYGGLNKLIKDSDRIINYPYDRIGYDLAFNEGEPVKTTDGRLLFNTNKGLLQFNPAEISSNPFTPQIYISSCYLNGEKVTIGENNTVRMKGGDKLIIDYRAIDMTNQEGVKYSYKIGNKPWSRLSPTSTITLEDLHPGKHYIQIKSTNAEGFDTDNTLSLTVRVGLKAFPFILFFLLASLAYWGISLIMKARKTGNETQSTPQTEPEISNEPKINEADAQFIKSLNALIEENLDNSSLNMEELASKMNMSRSNFYKKCREVMGKAPNELLKEARFKKACELLKDQANTIYQIAFMTGFNDSHYFAQAFKKEFGITPTEFRRQSQDHGA